MRLPTEVEPVKAILSTGASTRAAPVVPSPVTMLRTPLGRPASRRDFGEEEGGEGGVFGGFEDDGVAGGQRGGDLPGEHQEREVPGDDRAADAEGLQVGVFGGEELGEAGVVGEVAGDEGDVDVAATRGSVCRCRGFPGRRGGGSVSGSGGRGRRGIARVCGRGGRPISVGRGGRLRRLWRRRRRCLG